MPTLAPSTEACEAIRDRINSGTGYVLDVRAEVSELIVEDISEERQLRVDVVPESEMQMHDTIDAIDRTSHTIRVVIRKKLDDTTQDEINALKLLRRQIATRLMGFYSADRRVSVWEVDNQIETRTEQGSLHQHRAYSTSIPLRVEVAP
jgi:hypothetical protein